MPDWDTLKTIFEIAPSVLSLILEIRKARTEAKAHHAEEH